MMAAIRRIDNAAQTIMCHPHTAPMVREYVATLPFAALIKIVEDGNVDPRMLYIFPTGVLQ
jgi:hypothetical protein